MRPDSLLRLWRYINLLLTYLLTVGSVTGEENPACHLIASRNRWQIRKWFSPFAQRIVNFGRQTACLFFFAHWRLHCPAVWWFAGDVMVVVVAIGRWWVLVARHASVHCLIDDGAYDWRLRLTTTALTEANTRRCQRCRTATTSWYFTVIPRLRSFGIQCKQSKELKHWRVGFK